MNESMYPIGLYGSGMHEYVLDEIELRPIELRPRAAACADAEACGYSPLVSDPEPEAEP